MSLDRKVIRSTIQVAIFAWTISLLLLAGCAGSNDPVNQGKDQPVPAKKEKTKE